mmetsp:Transcript_1544/g.1645  ORF Transcript_1544/g.1645 Transcript_1544/m.1645 type:complete len:115 (+) Transcript_1544:311-655(+)
MVHFLGPASFLTAQKELIPVQGSVKAIAVMAAPACTILFLGFLVRDSVANYRPRMMIIHNRHPVSDNKSQDNETLDYHHYYNCHKGKSLFISLKKKEMKPNIPYVYNHHVSTHD